MIVTYSAGFLWSDTEAQADCLSDDGYYIDLGLADLD